MPPRFEILAYEPTSLGVLCLRQRELASDPGTRVTEVTLNGEFLMSSLLTDSERALARIGLEMHAGEELEVLVGGLGLGYTAQAALQSPRVSEVEVIEFLPQVIGWMQQGLVPLSEELNADDRVKISENDVYAFLTGPATTGYDLILIDVDHSPDDLLHQANSGFYSEQGLAAASKHLNPGGILGVWSYAESSPLADRMKEVFAETTVRPITAWNQLIDQQQTDWLFFARL